MEDYIYENPDTTIGRMSISPAGLYRLGLLPGDAERLVEVHLGNGDDCWHRLSIGELPKLAGQLEQFAAELRRYAARLAKLDGDPKATWHSALKVVPDSPIEQVLCYTEDNELRILLWTGEKWECPNKRYFAAREVVLCWMHIPFLREGEL